MNSNLLSLLVLAGIAVFLILRLRSVLGTRDGFEQPPAPIQSSRSNDRDFEVIDGGPDRDITDHVDEGSPSATALGAMKRVEPSFSVSEFLGGARGAYEMILMAYENDNLEEVKDFLAPDVYAAFAEGIDMRHEQGLTIDANFVGLREVSLDEASFNADTNQADLSIRFVGELTSVVKNTDGETVEGSPTEIKRQRDLWTFTRTMGSSDPNWLLTATGE